MATTSTTMLDQNKMIQQNEFVNALELLKRAALGYEHPNYKRTIEVDEICFEMCTGEGIEKHVKQFMPREDKTTFEHRKAAVKSVVPVVYNMLTDPQYQVPRSNNSVRVLTFANGDEKPLSELENILQRFNGKQGVDEWMATRWIDLNNESPNSWIILEWAPFDNLKERAQPYPYEVYADMVVDYAARNAETDYLIVKTKRSVLNNSISYDMETFTYYGKMQSIVLTKWHETEVLNSTQTKIFINDVAYYYNAPYVHSLGFVPAFRPGYNFDKTTRAKTYVSPINRAMPVLNKLLDADSEYDFTRACHVFPREYRYDHQCDNKGCNGGKLANGDKCPVCKGTGFLGSTDHDNTGTVVKIALPNNPNPDQIIDLAKMVYYAVPPIELLQVMRSHIADLKKECQTALYGSELFTKSEIAKTATGEMLDMQAMYNALYQMALNWSNDWEWLIKSIAAICELQEGLVCSYRFGKDLKLKSLNSLYIDLKTAADSGAAPFVKQAIQNDIARILYAEDSREMVKQSVMDWFDPFAGKSETERAWLVASNLVSKDNLILYANFMPIFKELEYEQGLLKQDFYKLSREKQIELIAAKVQALIEEMPKPEINLFALPPDTSTTTNPSTETIPPTPGAPKP